MPCTIRPLAAGLRSILAAVLVCAAAAAADQPQPQRDADQRRALRRTPVVEVFQQWRNSVVYLTGPTVPDGGPAIDEFFQVPRKTPNVVSAGSGFVIHPAGYILATAHSVDKVAAHLATFSNQTVYRAELIDVARQHDLALLKIEPTHRLTAVRLATSGDLMIGETVIVISNPHGLMHTCTAGILSATHRATRLEGQPGVTLGPLIQTDAGLHPGSSGGPWFNVLGEVIGITTGGRRDTEGIGFAVTVDAIRRMLPAMLDVERRYGIATGLDVHAGDSCKVMGVGGLSSAAAAGLRPGDLIVRLDGAPVASGTDFHLALIGRTPGEKLPFEVLRQGKRYRGSLTLGQRPKPDGAALLKARLGLTAAPLQQSNIPATSLRVAGGVVLTAVADGLYDQLSNPPRPGDVLARINRLRPRDLDHIGLLLERLEPGRPVQLVLLRLDGDMATRIDLTVTPRPPTTASQ
ncbi:MAG: trypsin-like peptidase domain-containing protein [Pirellulales bacterium]|nr:trypsin-like peptidase domain-containing protein [Pirellulales bacterium]